jgi:hypothetical protein
LDGYGVIGIFKFPYTPSCGPRRTEQLAGDIPNLVTYRLRCKHYFCHLTRPPNYRQSSFRISTCGIYIQIYIQSGPKLIYTLFGYFTCKECIYFLGHSVYIQNLFAVHSSLTRKFVIRFEKLLRLL